jgi:excisionase family DNA binding protein
MKDTKLTFDELPSAVSLITKELGELKQLLLLLQKQFHTSSPHQDGLLSTKEAAKFLKLAVFTIYNLSSKGELPVMKRGKRLYFSTADLNDYVRQGLRRSNDQIETDAIEHLSQIKLRGTHTSSKY